MFVVAVAEVLGSVEEAAAALAPIVERTEYEVRVALTGALPRVVFQSESRRRADVVLAAIVDLGHGALALDADVLVNGPAKLGIRRFALEQSAIVAQGRVESRFPFAEVGAIVVASARTDVWRTTTEVRVGSRFRSEPDVIVENTHHGHLDDHLAYLVPRPWSSVRERAWVLSESDSQFVALGPRMRPTRHENFFAAVELLAERAPHAIVDDRLLHAPKAAMHLVSVRGNDPASPLGADMNLELSILLLSTWLLRNDEGAAASCVVEG